MYFPSVGVGAKTIGSASFAQLRGLSRYTEIAREDEQQWLKLCFSGLTLHLNKMNAPGSERMGYLKVAFLVFFLFALTCGLCGVAVFLLQVSPLFGVAFLTLGTLGVVLAADVVQIFFSN